MAVGRPGRYGGARRFADRGVGGFNAHADGDIQSDGEPDSHSDGNRDGDARAANGRARNGHGHRYDQADCGSGTAPRREPTQCWRTA